MAAKRRAQDPVSEDHSAERSWWDAIPKRAFAACFSALVFLGAAAGSATITLLRDKWADMERRAEDPWKAELAKLSGRMGTVETRVDQHENLIRALDVRAQITEVQGDVKVINAKLGLLNERLSRKGF